MKINWIIVLATSLIPLLVGMLWYSKLLFVNVWLKESGVSQEHAEKINMVKAVGIALLLGVLISTCMLVWTVHQMSFFSIFGSEADSAALKDPTSSLSIYANDFMTKYGQNFRTFKHGAFHGVIGAIFLGFPFIGMSAIWERKSFKYVLIHVGYWIVTLALMGGVICQWA
jgi:NADH:ubiquinone oxidoreductase subunit 6 (subunit J)